MPELPEVETVRRGLRPAMEGATFLNVDQRRPDLRFPFPERFRARLEGKTMFALRRRAKFLIGELSSGECLIMHLGMSGRFTIEACHGEGEGRTSPGRFVHDVGGIAAHDHVVFAMSSGARITFNDPRRFGYMDIVPSDTLETCRHFAGLGVEPLGNAFDAAYLARRAEGRSCDLKAFLLDQRNIAGLGNIYVCEALHRSGISPRRRAATLSKSGRRPTERADRLAAAIRAVLTDAIAAGGSTLRDFASADGALGYFQHAFRVYGREGEPCEAPGCRGAVRRIVQAGRSTFFCGTCQR